MGGCGIVAGLKVEPYELSFTKSKNHIAQDGKGQILSERNFGFGVFKSSKKQTKFFEGLKWVKSKKIRPIIIISCS